VPITILDYVKSRVGEKLLYFAQDFYSNGVEMLGGCEQCHATIAAYNAYPSRSGFWRCADCIGDSGFATVEDFTRYDTEAETAAAGSVLLLTDPKADGADFDSALAYGDPDYDEPADFSFFDCPSCGEVSNIYEVRVSHERTESYVLECGECGVEWTP
jgi:predicted RNA-binding Zn-ribbon protein involved in translation (DUF1610 family)